MIDFCVLPTKNRLESEIFPQRGTLLGFDLEKSKTLKSIFKDKIFNEVRRVGFKNEAWEWSDQGDSLIFVFADHEANPTVLHQERALLTALELTSRINYKFTIGKEDKIDKYTEKNDSSHQFQRLRVALNSWDGGRDSLDLALADLNYVLNDQALKYTNTVFVIGDQLLNSLRGKYSTYRLNFSQVRKGHRKTGKNIYWSSTIGWRNLRLFLGGSKFCTVPKFTYRNYRYQVPGGVKLKLVFGNNGDVFSAQIHDISTTVENIRVTS